MENLACSIIALFLIVILRTGKDRELLAGKLLADVLLLGVVCVMTHDLNVSSHFARAIN